jgi:hypothetical protein
VTFISWVAFDQSDLAQLADPLATPTLAPDGFEFVEVTRAVQGLQLRRLARHVVRVAFDRVVIE